MLSIYKMVSKQHHYIYVIHNIFLVSLFIPDVFLSLLFFQLQVQKLHLISLLCSIYEQLKLMFFAFAVHKLIFVPHFHFLYLTQKLLHLIKESLDFSKMLFLLLVFAFLLLKLDHNSDRNRKRT